MRSRLTPRSASDTRWRKQHRPRGGRIRFSRSTGTTASRRRCDTSRAACAGRRRRSPMARPDESYRKFYTPRTHRRDWDKRSCCRFDLKESRSRSTSGKSRSWRKPRSKMRIAGAIDIGGTTTKIGVVAEDGTVLRRRAVATSAAGDPLPLVEAIASSLRLILEARESQRNPVAGVGVSVAGFLNHERSAMVHNANLPALRGFPLRRNLEERLSLECHLEVDSNAAVVAEYRH